jgi:hypothetical protein
MEFPMSGWLGIRLAFLKFRVSLWSTSDYSIRFRLSRTHAKKYIEFPISGSFCTRLDLLKFSVSLYNSSDFLSLFRF